MLQDLHLKVFKSHTLGELLIYPLAQDRVEELEEEPAEFILILLDLLGIQVSFGILNLIKVMFGIIPLEKMLSFNRHLMELL